jgi:hypothetical protein
VPTGDGFWVDFYINPVPVPTTGNQRWDILGSSVSPIQGIAWVIAAPGLAPGASITLTSDGIGGQGPSALHTVWDDRFVGGTSDLYIYVDSFSLDGSPDAGILESDETNNRSQLGIGPLSIGSEVDVTGLRDPADLPPRYDP